MSYSIMKYRTLNELFGILFINRKLICLNKINQRNAKLPKLKLNSLFTKISGYYKICNNLC